LLSTVSLSGLPFRWIISFSEVVEALYLNNVSIDELRSANSGLDDNISQQIDMAVEVALSLSSDFGWVILVAALLALEVIVFGSLFPGRMRRTLFNETFMKEKFAEIHAAELKEEITKGGYPDMGSGRYSQLLSYGEWYTILSDLGTSSIQPNVLI
jgi:hypothetical protein